MFHITTFTAANAVVGDVAVIECNDHSAMYATRRTLVKSALYSRILIENFIPGTGWVWYEDNRYTAEQLASQRALNKRIADEKRVVKRVVESAIRLGYMVTLWDGEEYTVKRSTDKAAILAAIYTTDMDSLSFRDKQGTPHGNVLFMYGNEASSVMADWTDNAEVNAILADAIAYCDKLSEKGL